MSNDLVSDEETTIPLYEYLTHGLFPKAMQRIYKTLRRAPDCVLKFAYELLLKHLNSCKRIYHGFSHQRLHGEKTTKLSLIIKFSHSRRLVNKSTYKLFLDLLYIFAFARSRFLARAGATSLFADY